MKLFLQRGPRAMPLLAPLVAVSWILGCGDSATGDPDDWRGTPGGSAAQAGSNGMAGGTTSGTSGETGAGTGGMPGLAGTTGAGAGGVAGSDASGQAGTGQAGAGGGAGGQAGSTQGGGGQAGSAQAGSTQGGGGQAGSAQAGSTQGGGGQAGSAQGGAAGVAGVAGVAGMVGGAGMANQTSCPMDLAGWATVSGDGVSTTTGGGNTTPVQPTSEQQLIDYAKDATPRVIQINRAFNVPRLEVASNKTLIGVGPNAQINGGVRIRGSANANVQNVILRNLRVNGRTTDVDGDAVQIYFAHHVWVDHCEIWDGVDANLDVVHASNWVTISWTKFRYSASPPDPTHKFSNLIGHSDSATAESEDSGRLKVTLHHNWWAEGVTERMPRVRFGEVHVYNNYFSSAGNNYCIRAGLGARILAESNFFQGVKDPYVFNSTADQATAHITKRNSVYMNVTGATGNAVPSGGGTPFTNPPYNVTIDAANTVAQRVQMCAGPR